MKIYFYEKKYPLRPRKYQNYLLKPTGLILNRLLNYQIFADSSNIFFTIFTDTKRFVYIQSKCTVLNVM